MQLGLGLSEGMSVELGFVAAVRVFGLVLLGAGSFFFFLFFFTSHVTSEILEIFLASRGGHASDSALF
jgi:hypothetical protein